MRKLVVAAGATTDVTSNLDDAFRSDDADAIIAIGGTGEGRNDRSVIALARAGNVVCHGIGLAPGETAAFGMAKGRPVLLMPGRIDAALACWLAIGRPLLDRLSGASAGDNAITATLARKVTSTVGIAEVIPLRRSGDTGRAAGLRLSVAAIAGARRRMDAGAGGERRLSGRDRRRR